LTYKKKVSILSAIVTALALIYILTFVFDPENRRSAAFAWLEPSLLVMADGIEISTPESRNVLKRRNDIWFVADADGEFPAKQDRVADLFALLTRRENYPVRASSSEGIERLGLTEGSASRIVVRGGAGLPLLDLLIGGANALDTEVYLRRTGWNQIYSAEDDYSSFTELRTRSWYDLRLFSEGNPDPSRRQVPSVSVDSIQQVEVSFPDEAYILRRSGRGWIIVGKESIALDAIMVEAILRLLLEAEADNFSVIAPETTEASITIQFGNGSTRTLQAGPLTAQNTRYATVSGSPYYYILAEHTFNTFFRDSSFFYGNAISN
jgi:hypothetical protein